jgi:hypothetical protein
VLGWLLFALLGIIWTAFLLPRRHSSPLGSAKEFERTLHLLAEANRNVPGRWVLVPPKGRPLDGGQAARRARARRRRRLVFMLLGDGALLSGVMGAFPGLRSMLYGTAALGTCLVFYSGFLLAVARRERAAVRRRRYGELQTKNGHRLAAASGNGHPANGNGHAVARLAAAGHV